MQHMSNRLVWILVGLLAFIITIMLVLSTEQGGAAAEYVWTRIRGGYSVDDRLEMHRADVQQRVAPMFAAAGLAWPPRQLALLAFKDQRTLELYARDRDTQAWTPVTGYPILGMSGRLGPKLREGDFQVPEGLYRVEFLNANSQFHLSIRLNYPNAFDRERGVADGRTNLGTDIMIHGSTASIGCLAMGNQVAEDLFIMAALAGRENVQVLIAPTDFRRARAAVNVAGPAWLSELYQNLTIALRDFPAAL
jgi:murein L,D-transpeptidase YafK